MRVRLSRRITARLSGATHPLFPGCALPCLTSITSASCAANDTKCLCQDKDFVSKTTACFQTNCKGDDLTKSVAAAVEMCRSVVSCHFAIVLRTSSNLV